MQQLMDLSTFVHNLGNYNVFNARRLALVNAQNGNLMMMHLENMLDDSHIIATSYHVRQSAHPKWTHVKQTTQFEPFTDWFAYSYSFHGLVGWVTGKQLESSSPLLRLQAELSRLEMLIRTENAVGPYPGMTFYHTLLSRGGVYYAENPVAKLENCEPAVDESWSVFQALTGGIRRDEWPPMRHWPYLGDSAESGWTQ